MYDRNAHSWDDDPPNAVKMVGRVNLILGAAFFLALTLGVFYSQFTAVPKGHGPAWDELQWIYLLPILVCLPIEPVAAGLRIWLVCRLLHPGVNLWSCIKTDLANIAVSMLTPSQTGGGAAQIYMLHRNGVTVGTALTICLLSFAGTLVGLLCMGLYSLAVSELNHQGLPFVAAAWTLIATSLTVILAVAVPGLARVVLAIPTRALRRIKGMQRPLPEWRCPGGPRTSPAPYSIDPRTAKFVDLLYTYRNDIVRFVAAGKGTFVWICLLSLVFLFSRSLLAYLGIRFLGIEGSSFRDIVHAQMALIFLMFFAPTPGGAGLAEVASSAIVTGIVPADLQPYYHLLWRSLTLYLPATAGAFCLLRAIIQDARKFVHDRRKRGALNRSIPKDGCAGSRRPEYRCSDLEEPR